MEIEFESNIGKKREVDEDSISVLEYSSHYEEEENNSALLALADGAGGQGSGEVCSRIVLETLTEELSEILLSEEYCSSYYVSIGDRIEQAVKESHKDVISKAKADDSLNNRMASTLSMGIVIGNGFYYGHVGDSRIYILDDAEIRQITKDHSRVQQLLDKGEITEEEAKDHPEKNVITRAIGAGQRKPPEPDIGWEPLYRGQYILICCDGVTDVLEDGELLDIVNEADNLEDACNNVIEEANDRGSPDNVSLILAKPTHISESLDNVLNKETEVVDEEDFMSSEALQIREV